MLGFYSVRTVQSHTKLEEVLKKSCNLCSTPAGTLAYLESCSKATKHGRTIQVTISTREKRCKPWALQGSDRVLIYSLLFIVSVREPKRYCTLTGCLKDASLYHGKMPGRGTISTKPFHSSQSQHPCLVTLLIGDVIISSQTLIPRAINVYSSQTTPNHKVNFIKSDVWSFDLSYFLGGENTKMQLLKRI